MNKVKIFVIATLAAAATVLPLSSSAAAPAPGAAEPAQSVQVRADTPPTAAMDLQRPGACRHAWMRIWGGTVTVHAEPRDGSQELTQLTIGYKQCRAFVAGGQYTACGATNTGWILVPILPAPQQGWIASQCTEDPILG
jgi:hypothetical protein